MKRLVLLGTLLVGTIAWAGTIQISPSPVPLKGAFQVEVMGIQAENGDAVVVNVNTGELLRVPLKPEGGKLVSEEIYALRDCDSPPEEAKYVLHVAVGQVIAAATGLEDGLSATSSVAPPQGPAALSLYSWSGERNTWCPQKAEDPLSPGKLLIQVDDPSGDVSCGEESVPVVISVGGEELQLDLRETGPAAGRFTAEVVLVVEPKATNLVVKVVHQGSELLSTEFVPGITLKVTYGTLVLEHSLAQLEAGLSLEPGAREDVGCPVRILVTGAEPDEVVWYVAGMQQPERGRELRLIRGEPTYPEMVPIVALIRQGTVWGKAETWVSFVPPTEISFVDAETEETISGSCPCGRTLKVKLTCAYDDPMPRVWVGVLGPNCSSRALSLVRQADGEYLSEAFSTDELSACAGDVLWAQYKDPTCLEDVAYVLLILR